jgi:hypothetical protein
MMMLLNLNYSRLNEILKIMKNKNNMAGEQRTHSSDDLNVVRQVKRIQSPKI